jgi:hypothetical protein
VSTRKKTSAQPAPTTRSPAAGKEGLAQEAFDLITSAAALADRGEVAGALRVLKQLAHAFERGAARGLAKDKLQVGVDVLERVFRNGDAEQRAQALALLERLDAVRMSLLR